MTPLQVSAWPLTVRVSVLVIAMVLGVAGGTSALLLSFEAREQRHHLDTMAAAYLDALGASLQNALARRDVWEAFDVMDRASVHPGALTPKAIVAVLPDGSVLASSRPRQYPVGSTVSADLLSALRNAPSGGLRLDPGTAMFMHEVWGDSGGPARIIATFEIESFQASGRASRNLLAALTVGMAAFLSVTGWFVVRRMLRPTERLARHFAAAQGAVPPPLPAEVVAGAAPEFRRLFAAVNETLTAARQRDAMAARLHEAERLAQLGRLAAGLAHEVNNPLAGILTALDTIERHGSDPAVTRRALGHIRRGLHHIRDVVRANLVLYKAPPQSVSLAPDALESLVPLVRQQAGRRGVALDWDTRLQAALPIDGTAVQQIALNLVLNAIAASRPGTVVEVRARSGAGCLELAVTDQGGGMPAPLRAALAEGAAAPPPVEGGLGLWTAATLAKRLGGGLACDADHAPGTRVVLTVPITGEHAIAA